MIYASRKAIKKKSGTPVGIVRYDDFAANEKEKLSTV